MFMCYAFDVYIVLICELNSYILFLDGCQFFIQANIASPIYNFMLSYCEYMRFLCKCCIESLYFYFFSH